MSKWDIEELKRLLSELESMSIDEIRSKLQLYSTSYLRALASIMIIGSLRGQSKENLIHIISMKIANLRGYKSLMDQK